MAKFYGESEALINAYFEYAKSHSPAVIFIDEIESLISKRGSKESNDMGRIKSHLLDAMSGARNSGVTIVGATNLPGLCASIDCVHKLNPSNLLNFVDFCCFVPRGD